MNEDCDGSEGFGAERRRRLELNEKMLALASLVPNLTKGDRVSVIGGAIEYIHKLRRTVKELQIDHDLLLVETSNNHTGNAGVIVEEAAEDQIISPRRQDDHDQGRRITKSSTTICQLCYKYGHLASHCQFRFLETFNNPYYAAAANTANTANINNNSLCISCLARNSS